MKNLILTYALCLLSLVAGAQLKVSADGRFLETYEGKPFFWLGDTAWELFHRLNREEAEKYLRHRADNKFNVIQAVALAELDGINTPNAYGELPLDNQDPRKPREEYFKHVDFVMDKAKELGLYIALLPTWGDKVFKNTWGTGPEIFNKDNARVYGHWIGNRYKNHSNIIWIIGGDRNPRNEEDVLIWRAMAEGIAEGVGGNNKALMTFHPQPNGVNEGGSAKWFHKEKWLDFNMLQTGHCRENNLWDRIGYDYNLSPTKPVLNGEPTYENHPVCFNAKDLGLTSAYDVRIGAWQSVFSGAFGHTYGCHNIWQMYEPKREPVNGPTLSWLEALSLPGARQMQYLRLLMESRPMQDRFPDQTTIINSLNNSDKIIATRGKGYLFVYSTQGKAFKVDLSRLERGEYSASWYNPRNGDVKAAHQFRQNVVSEFVPPTSGYGHDWVLVLDDKKRDYSFDFIKSFTP